MSISLISILLTRSDSSMDDKDLISAGNSHSIKHVQIPLWTIRTTGKLATTHPLPSSDSSMDDKDPKTVDSELNPLEMFRFLYGR